MICKIFLPFRLFILLIVSFAVQKLFKIIFKIISMSNMVLKLDGDQEYMLYWASQATPMEKCFVWCSSTCIFLLLLPLFLVWNFKKSSQKCTWQGKHNVLLYEFYESRSVSWIFNSFFNFYVWYKIAVQSTQPHLLKRLSFPHYIFLAALS